ncbi:MAG: hypothetical protein QM305_03870, partial [Bacteroidota bacterium]|nr:hypothetical protein [Bacteroidota bacterium]
CDRKIRGDRGGRPNIMKEVRIAKKRPRPGHEPWAKRSIYGDKSGAPVVAGSHPKPWGGSRGLLTIIPFL